MDKIIRTIRWLKLTFLVVSAITALNISQLCLADTLQDSLFETLATAETELDGKTAENALWQYWFDQSPTTEDRMLLDAAIERREAYDFEAAEQHLDKLVKSAPGYAEAYNQRAFIRFLRENFSGAKVDLQKAVQLEPRHFGAWSGLYLVLSRQAQHDQAFFMLQKAVTIHPWLKERSALPKALWPKSYINIHDPGQDI